MNFFWLGKSLYWSSAGIFIAWLCLLGRLPRPSGKIIGSGILFALGLSLLVRQLSPPRVRVLWDENNLLLSSLSMHYAKTADAPVMALPSPQGMIPVSSTIDKRPPLFPFLASLLPYGSTSGEANLFLLNQILLGLFLFGIFVGVQSHFGMGAAVGSLLLVLASPLTVEVASSGSLDFLSCASILLFAHSLTALSNSKRQTYFCLASGLLAAYSRYEMVIYVLLGFGFWLFRDAKRPRLGPWEIAACALALGALTPLLLQLIFVSNHFVEARSAFLFQPKYFAQNFWPLINAFFNPFAASLYPCIVFLAGLLAFFWVFFGKKLGRNAKLLAALFLLQTILILFYFEGNPLGAVSARLYLLPNVLLSLSPLLLFLALPKRWATTLVLGMAIAGFAWNIKRGPAPLRATRELEVASALDNLFSEGLLDKGHDLVVSNLHFYFISHGIAALSPPAFIALEAKIKERMLRKEIANVYWSETPVDDPFGLALAESKRLREKYSWRPSLERENFKLSLWKP